MKKVFYVVLLGLFLTGCGPSAEQLTATAVMAQAQTQTAAPTFTPTATLTPTLTPTVTLTPTPTLTRTPQPTATPFSLGEKTKFDFLPLEVTVLWAETHSHIVPGGYYYYYSKPGYIYVELGILIRNTSEKPVKLQLKDIYLTEEDGKTHFGVFGTSQTVDVDQPFNPISIKLVDTINTGNEQVSVEKDTYFRLIFYLKEKQKLVFRVLNSPKVAFQIK